MKTTLLILLTIIKSLYADNARDNTKICDILHMIESQECKDNTSPFCQYVDQIEKKLCPDNLTPFYEEYKNNKDICSGLDILTSEECKENFTEFCKLAKKVYKNLCTDTIFMLKLLETDWACKYVVCPPDTPYCKDGQCFPTNSTKPIDYGCKYRKLYSPCPPDTPYCKDGKCYKNPQNTTLVI